MKKSSIKDVVIAITYKCNSRCRMCNIWQMEDYRYELPVESLRGLPRTLKDINISGGEPFLHKDLPGAIKFLSQHCPKANIVISTNGFATDLIIKQLKEIRLVMPNIGVAFSLDGIGIAHDRIRGVNKGYEKVVKTIKAAEEIGVKNIKIAFTLADYNANELPKVYKLSEELGAEFSFTLVHSSDNFFSKQNKIVNKQPLSRALAWLIGRELRKPRPKNWARAYYAWGALNLLATGQRILPDYSGIYNIFVDPRGDVYACDVASKSMGELSQTGLNIRKGIIRDPACEQSWMVCTARPAIKKHMLKALTWIAINKLRALF